MNPNTQFWTLFDELIATSTLIIDRPKGSRHPRYPEMLYPLDYCYLEGTSAADSDGIDVWRGSDPAQRFDALVCTVDMVKRDTEVKLLIGCTADEKQTVLDFHNEGGKIGAVLVERG